MAKRSDLDCVSHPGEPGVAFVSHPLTDIDSITWHLYCTACVTRFRSFDDDARYIHIADVITTSEGDRP